MYLIKCTVGPGVWNVWQLKLGNFQGLFEYNPTVSTNCA